MIARVCLGHRATVFPSPRFLRGPEGMNLMMARGFGTGNRTKQRPDCHVRERARVPCMHEIGKRRNDRACDRDAQLSLSRVRRSGAPI